MATVTFLNTTADGDLGNALNWDSLSTPVSGDTAIIQVAATIGDIADCAALVISVSTGGGNLVTSGTCSIAGILNLSGLTSITAAGWTINSNIVMTGVILNGAAIPLPGGVNFQGCTVNCVLTYDGNTTFTSSASALNAATTVATGGTIDGSFQTLNAFVDASAGGVTIQNSPNFTAGYTGGANTFSDTANFSGGTATFGSTATIDGVIMTFSGSVNVVQQAGCTIQNNPSFPHDFRGTDAVWTSAATIGGDANYTSSTPFTWLSPVVGATASNFSGPINVAVAVGSILSLSNGAYSSVSQVSTVELTDTVQPVWVFGSNSIQCNGIVVFSPVGAAAGTIDLSGLTIEVGSGTTIIASAVAGDVVTDGGTNFSLSGGAKGYAIGVTIPGSTPIGGSGPMPMIGSPLIRFLSAA